MFYFKTTKYCKTVVSFCNIFKHKSFAFTTSSHKKLSLFIDRCYPEKQFYNNETKNKPSLNEIMSWFRHLKFANGFFREILDIFTHRSRYFQSFVMIFFSWFRYLKSYFQFLKMNINFNMYNIKYKKLLWMGAWTG